MGEEFRAGIVGLEHANMRGTGWPVAVVVDNSGSISAGTYKTRRYVPERTCALYEASSIDTGEISFPRLYCSGCGNAVPYEIADTEAGFF